MGWSQVYSVKATSSSLRYLTQLQYVHTYIVTCHTHMYIYCIHTCILLFPDPVSGGLLCPLYVYALSLYLYVNIRILYMNNISLFIISSVRYIYFVCLAHLYLTSLLYVCRLQIPYESALHIHIFTSV
jgi:hypothetical protein